MDRRSPQRPWQEWLAVSSLFAGVAVALLLLLTGSLSINRDNAVAFADSTLLGPLLAIGGAWLNERRGQPFGLIVLGLAFLLALDGAIATFFVGLPVFVLILLSFLIGIRRRSSSRGL